MKTIIPGFDATVEGNIATLKPKSDNKAFEEFITSKTEETGIAMEQVAAVRALEKSFGSETIKKSADTFKEIFKNEPEIGKVTIITPFGAGNDIKKHNIAVVGTKDAKFRTPGSGEEGVNTRIVVHTQTPGYVSKNELKSIAADVRASFID